MSDIDVSASRLDLFLDCTHAYYCRYFLLLKDEGGDKTRLGSCIHEIFELISAPKKHVSRRKYIRFSIENGNLHPVILKIYKKYFKKYKIGKLTNKGEDLFDIGNNLIHNAFCKGYDSTHEVLAVEHYFRHQIGKGIYIKGYIDKILKINDTTLEMVDYKSGQPFNFEDANKKFQPFMYKMAAKVDFPKYKNFLFNFHFLKNKKIVPVDVLDARVERFKEFVITNGKKMMSFTQKDASAKKSWKCGFCAFRKPNETVKYMGCPAFYDKKGKELYS